MGAPVYATGRGETVPPALGTEGTDALDVRALTVDLGGQCILDGIDLTVAHGEFLSLLGPSGCGKSTLLRTLGGFIQPRSGEIRMAGRDVTGLPPHRRGVGIVFQSYALFGHMTVAGNVGYGLRTRRRPTADRRRTIAEMLEVVQLDGLADRYPRELSGGQQQRVALARALAIEPSLLLLDEPLSNLDANLRTSVGEQIRRIQQRTGTTTIMVTHDRGEAFGMSDRVAVISAGTVVQNATPEAIYQTPANEFVAEFGGEINRLPVTVDRVDDDVAVVTAGGTTLTTHLLSHGPRSGRASLMLRPEDVKVLRPGESRVNEVEVEVAERYFYGGTTTLVLDAADSRFRARVSGRLAADCAPGVRIRVGWDEECTFLAGATS